MDLREHTGRGKSRSRLVLSDFAKDARSITSALPFSGFASSGALTAQHLHGTKTAVDRPEILVIAGPHGAGKTTVASSALPERFPTYTFINADEIAKSAGTASARVARSVMLQRMQEARAWGDTFAFETTLATRSYAQFLTEARQYGYLIHIVYVSLASVELAKKRVAVRLQRGGRDIPTGDIERRYWRSAQNFFCLYAGLADTWVLCNNSRTKLFASAELNMRRKQASEAYLRKRVEDISEGLREAIDREVETLRREGFPIYVSEENRQVIDLQQTEREVQSGNQAAT